MDSFEELGIEKGEFFRRRKKNEVERLKEKEIDRSLIRRNDGVSYIIEKTQYYDLACPV
jgi:hypothetical protein